jgi:diacylglycerol kinase (ATP)
MAIATYRPVSMRLALDGEDREGRFLIVLCSNGVHFGSGMKAAPAARMDDGRLDVTTAGDLGVRDSIVALLKLYRGTHVDGVGVQTRTVRSLEVRLAAPLPMEMDGEVARVDSLSVKARPASLQVLAR